MEFIAHRINTVHQLKAIPRQYGVELDLRDRGSRLILQHEPFADGEDFEQFLTHYRHGTMILNIKSERIEHEVLRLLRKHGIDRYFFLDSSFPMIHLLSKAGESNIALRFSEYEGLDTVMAMKERVRWVWVDCFQRFPMDRPEYDFLKAAGFKLCLVSPELQGREDDIRSYRAYIEENAFVFDAICTKVHNIPRWCD